MCTPFGTVQLEYPKRLQANSRVVYTMDSILSLAHRLLRTRFVKCKPLGKNNLVHTSREQERWGAKVLLIIGKSDQNVLCFHVTTFRMKICMQEFRPWAVASIKQNNVQYPLPTLQSFSFFHLHADMDSNIVVPYAVLPGERIARCSMKWRVRVWINGTLIELTDQRSPWEN